MGFLSLVPIGLFALISTTPGALAIDASESANITGSSIKKCIQLKVPVAVMANQYHYDQPEVNNNLDAIDWTINVTTYNMSSFIERQRGNVTVDQKFNISAQLCVPTGANSKASILQIATAGQGFDRRYFDAEIDPQEYSYVDAAVSKGYSVLVYDRLGTGASEKPNAYDILQVPTDVEVLTGLTKIARAGNLINSSQSSAEISKDFDFIPTQIVHIGHAYGSYLMHVMYSQYGSHNLSDGAIMTGFYLNTAMQEDPISVLAYNHVFPREDDPVRFAEWGSGYIVLDTKETLQKLFFQKQSLDPALLDYTESIKQPESVGQYASEGLPVPAPNFTAPIMFFTGEFDNYVCNGDCNGIYNATWTEYLYPGASRIYPYLQPKTGHAPGLSTNASGGYDVILQFLDSQGL